MRTTEVRVTVGRTVSRNYNSIRLEFSETVEVEENHDPRAVRVNLYIQLSNELEEFLKEVKL